MCLAVFFYSGAASAAGTNYMGALVITPDGRYGTGTFYHIINITTASFRIYLMVCG